MEYNIIHILKTVPSEFRIVVMLGTLLLWVGIVEFVAWRVSRRFGQGKMIKIPKSLEMFVGSEELLDSGLINDVYQGVFDGEYEWEGLSREEKLSVIEDVGVLADYPREKVLELIEFLLELRRRKISYTEVLEIFSTKNDHILKTKL
jgi:hypothetical protein